MKALVKFQFIVTFVYLLCSHLWLCAQPELIHSVFLIGDAGEPYVEQDPIGNVFRKKIEACAEKATVVYLGDNVYPKGLTFEGERLRKDGEEVLQNQYSWIKGLPARGFFIPGNHDWHHWGRKGYEYIINQQKWIDSLKDERVTISPRDGCPGPVEIPLTNNLVLVIIDTQWLLHQWEKPAEEGSCDAKTTADLLSQLEDVFVRNRTKRVIVAAHHPLITYGEHGGVFPLKSHIFPLEELTEHLYIPLPIIGSIYPLYRKYFGHLQDTQHPLYKDFGESIQKIMAEYPGSVYVAGHEHALQYIGKDSSHFIVSGSGAKVEFAKKKKHAVYVNPVRGFAVLNAYSNGNLELQFFQVDNQNPTGREIYKKVFPDQERLRPRPSEPIPDLDNKVVKVQASAQYQAGKLRQYFLGENYRREWSQPVVAPVFDIGSDSGGLKILQRGGGMQTLSLRLEDSTGREYVLRSVEKYPEHAVPLVLRQTFAQDLVQDQISASHPYAAIVIPKLAEAAGIYHTNPQLVYLPNDPRFGEYQKLFANSLAIFEERPSGDWSNASFFGNSKKIVNTGKVLEKIFSDNDNYVDQEFVLRSRLFDMIIGDWDRHDDQWRWAKIKEKKGDVFRPIPRDRDQAFFVNQGVLSKLWSRKWALPKFEGFDDDIRWPSGLSFNARYFDRNFLNELSEEQWLLVADDLKKSLDDQSIENAINVWPKSIFDGHGEFIIKSIKSRRDKIARYASSHYRFLAKEVDVTGSDKAEEFHLRRKENGDIELDVYKITKENQKGKKLYDRTFLKSETKEIRLYGLGGDDEFNFEGDRSKIKVRVIGGAGYDTLKDNSKGRSKTLFYDQFENGKVIEGNGVKDRRSENAEVNDYNRKAFQYNRFAPLIYGQWNKDDGAFLGSGFVAINHGFRKTPFRQRHIFLASFAPLTSSYNFRYQARFTELVAKWDADVDINVKSPNYVNNFFGMGNESVFNRRIDEVPGISVEDPIDFYRYRFEEMLIDLTMIRKFSNWGSFRIGPALQRIEMEEPGLDEDRFISAYALDSKPDLFDEYNSFGGVTWQVALDTRNDQKFTTRGTLLSLSGRNMRKLLEGGSSFSSYESSISFYHRFRAHGRLMFALRFGGGLSRGDYQFYQAQILDGKTELRGFRKTRFYGDAKAYSNAEVRLKLTSFRTYLFPATVGILAFHDAGRVWYKDESGNDPSAADGSSHRWHRGWGGGLWFTPFNLATVSLEVGHSPEGTLGYVRLGFLF
jgi:hypothetical protein